jgi:fermentation-respiration switch protein FrsA (DUF1100 family)
MTRSITATRFLFSWVILASTTTATGPAQDRPNASDSPHKNVPSLDELLLFFPSKYPSGNWKPADLRIEDVAFVAEDGTQLHGWYCPCEQPRATILIAHGNAGHVASRAGWLKLLQTRLRVATFIFDYRGYGRSQGLPTVEGVLLDAKAARGKLRELAGVKDSEILLMGESLGGAIAVQLAADAPPKALILQSTFSSLRNVADFHYPKLSWLVPPGKLDSATRIARYRGPLFQSHGTADRTIPFSSGERLFQSAHEPKTLIRLAGAGHNDWLTEDYVNRLDAFIAGLQPVKSP